jgi:hypothetical protein
LGIFERSLTLILIPAFIANLADLEQKEYKIRVQADRALRSFPSLIQTEVAAPSSLPHSLRHNYPIATSLSHNDIFLGEAQMRVLDKKMSLEDNRRPLLSSLRRPQASLPHKREPTDAGRKRPQMVAVHGFPLTRE